MGGGAASLAQYSGAINNMVDKIFPINPPLLINGVPQPYKTMPNIYEMLSYELNSMNFIAVLPPEYQAGDFNSCPKEKNPTINTFLGKNINSAAMEENGNFFTYPSDKPEMR